jgi:hypothetical protein
MANSTASPIVHGPYSIQDLINMGYSKHSPKPKHQGIYVWGVKVEEMMYPMYVGKDSHIIQRIFEHLAELTGGNKTIPDWNTITNVNRNIPALKKLLHQLESCQLDCFTSPLVISIFLIIHILTNKRYKQQSDKFRNITL